MGVIFFDVKRQSSQDKEPYSAFAKKYKALKGNIDSSEIELNIGNGKEGFCKGFYRDEDYMVNPKLKFIFGSDIRNSDRATGCFIRMTYSFECNDCNFDFYRRHIKLLKARAPYLYIPSVTHFEITSHIDDRFELIFDVIVPDKSKIEESCYSLISTIIAILSFED